MENNEKMLSEIDSNVEQVEDLDGSDVEVASEDEAEKKAQELMDLISQLEVLRSYRKAKRSGERCPITKEERKKKKAKRRMANKSKR